MRLKWRERLLPLTPSQTDIVQSAACHPVPASTKQSSIKWCFKSSATKLNQVQQSLIGCAYTCVTLGRVRLYMCHTWVMSPCIRVTMHNVLMLCIYVLCVCECVCLWVSLDFRVIPLNAVYLHTCTDLRVHTLRLVCGYISCSNFRLWVYVCVWLCICADLCVLVPTSFAICVYKYTTCSHKRINIPCTNAQHACINA
jgi:hypothetical protein